MKTPTAPPESRPRPMPRQALQGTSRFPCFGFRHSETVADRIIIIDEAALDFGECGPPCGLHASLCTLRMFCSAIDHSGSIPPPHTQHSVRVVGYSLPDGDLHPTRSIELLGARRGRDTGYPVPPAQIPACGFPAPGSSKMLASAISRREEQAAYEQVSF
jgi:hypothetical protein